MSKLKKQNIQESYFLDTVLDVIYSQKLQDIIIYKGNNSLAYQNIIISTANSNTQMNGVVKKISDILKDKSSLNVEGKDSSWLLVEVKDVLIPMKSGYAITANLKLKEKRLISIISDLLTSLYDSLQTIRQ